jgi:trk system potassium uptake protein TrkH
MHYFGYQARSFKHYFRDSETVFWGNVMFVAVIIVSCTLIISSDLSVSDSLLYGIFQTISIATTTGFTTTDFYNWPHFLPIMLVLLSCMGACAGSTGGGMKAVRVMLIAKQGIRELAQLIHPNAVIPLKVGNKRVEAKVVSAVWSFVAVYLFAYMVIMLLLMATGLDFVTAFSAGAASMNNLGQGLGDVGSNYSNVQEPSLWIMCFAMLLGRLEVFTLLVIFSPAFWRR